MVGTCFQFQSRELIYMSSQGCQKWVQRSSEIKSTPYPNLRPSLVSPGPGQESHLVKTDNEFYKQRIVRKARESGDTRKEASEPAPKDIEDDPKTYNRIKLYMPGGMAVPSTEPTEHVTNRNITDRAGPSSTMSKSNDNGHWDTNRHCLTAYIGSWHGTKPTYEDPHVSISERWRWAV